MNGRRNFRLPLAQKMSGTIHHRNTAVAGPIAVVNLFLGWTLLGWVVALAWACAADPDARH